MKKIIFIFILITNISFLFSQGKMNKQDKKTLKKVESINLQLLSINSTLKSFKNKATQNILDSKVSRALLTEEERNSIDNSKDSLQRTQRVDSILKILKKDANRYLALTMIANNSLNPVPIKMNNLFEIIDEYGYLSKSRIDKLNIADKLEINMVDIISEIPVKYHTKLLSIIDSEYSANKLIENEYVYIKTILNGK